MQLVPELSFLYYYNTSYKYSRSFTFSDTNTNKIYILDQPLNLNEEYVFTLKLDRFLAWETVVNIDNTKNKLRYSPDNGVNWRDVTIPKGIRSTPSINNIFKEQMKNNGIITLLKIHIILILKLINLITEFC